jgi:hypothetical protein
MVSRLDAPYRHDTGKDATEAFEDVGHSEEARKLLKDMYKGDFDGVVRLLSRVLCARATGGLTLTCRYATLRRSTRSSRRSTSRAPSPSRRHSRRASLQRLRLALARRPALP